MPERPNGADSKSDGGDPPHVGSNPTPSVRLRVANVQDELEGELLLFAISPKEVNRSRYYMARILVSKHLLFY